MNKQISYLGFFFIPLISVCLVLISYFIYYTDNDRLTRQLTIESEIEELRPSLLEKSWRVVGDTIEITKVIDNKVNQIEWTRAVTVDRFVYKEIVLSLDMPDNYRGLGLVFEAKDLAGNISLKRLPVLYDIDGLVALPIAELISEDEVISRFSIVFEHELYSPIIVGRIQVIPNKMTANKFISLAINQFSDLHLTKSRLLFSPIVFMGLVCAMMIGLMIVVYGRIFGVVVCIFSSLAIVMVLMSIATTSNTVLKLSRAYKLGGSTSTSIQNIPSKQIEMEMQSRQGL